MNKIVGYIAVATVSVATVAFTKDSGAAILISLIGFYFIATSTN